MECPICAAYMESRRDNNIQRWKCNRCGWQSKLPDPDEPAEHEDPNWRDLPPLRGLQYWTGLIVSLLIVAGPLLLINRSGWFAPDTVEKLSTWFIRLFLPYLLFAYLIFFILKAKFIASKLIRFHFFWFYFGRFWIDPVQLFLLFLLPGAFICHFFVSTVKLFAKAET